MSKENVFCYIAGTAGAGKSTLTRAFHHNLTLRGLDSITVNLDPGAHKLPYDPDVDIRDWIRLDEVMKEHDLGPNGAQVAAADLLAVNLDEVREEIEQFKADYVLVDTPGQIELFVFREAGRFVVHNLAPGRSMVAYLFDPFLARTANGFVSQLLLGATTQFRLQAPMSHVLSKADVLDFDDLETIRRWSVDHDALWEAINSQEPDMQQQFSNDLIRVLNELGGFPGLTQVSSASGEGFDDLYNEVQQNFFASDDLLSD